MAMMESFVQRFNRLEAQRETGNELIKVGPRVPLPFAVNTRP